MARQNHEKNYSKSDWRYTSTLTGNKGLAPNDNSLSEHYLCHTSCRWTNAGYRTTTSEVFCEVSWTEGSTRPQELVSQIVVHAHMHILVPVQRNCFSLSLLLHYPGSATITVTIRGVMTARAVKKVKPAHSMELAITFKKIMWVPSKFSTNYKICRTLAQFTDTVLISVLILGLGHEQKVCFPSPTCVNGIYMYIYIWCG